MSVTVEPRLWMPLPGQWHHVPLTDRAEAMAAIRAYAVDVAGSHDAQALQRARLIEALKKLLDEADDRRLTTLYLAIEPVPGLTLSIALLESRPDINLSPSIGTAGPDVLEVLLNGLAEYGEPIDEAERYSVGDSAVARQSRVTVEKVADEGTEYEISQLAIDYWITIPGHKRVALVTFLTPHADLVDPLLVLFDSIVAGLQWADEATPDDESDGEEGQQERGETA